MLPLLKATFTFLSLAFQANMYDRPVPNGCQSMVDLYKSRENISYDCFYACADLLKFDKYQEYQEDLQSAEYLNRQLCEMVCRKHEAILDTRKARQSHLRLALNTRFCAPENKKKLGMDDEFCERIEKQNTVCNHIKYVRPVAAKPLYPKPTCSISDYHNHGFRVKNLKRQQCYRRK